MLTSAKKLKPRVLESLPNSAFWSMKKAAKNLA
jgi:hypothetical protein